MSRYALGLDYGSDSVRALLVDVTSGQEVASHAVFYPRWSKGMYCLPADDQFRQHPQDYLDSLEQVMAGLWTAAPANAAANVIGLSIDTTGSTPVAVNKLGVPLAMTEAFAENPNAMFILWKDHTSVAEAKEITQAADSNDINYLQYMGGIYSSEWFWAKALHILRTDESVRAATHSWVEHCDWLIAVLTGTTHPRDFRLGRCAAGHKMMWNQQWGGFPPNSFFTAIDPLLDGLVDTLNPNTETSDKVAGKLTEEWAQRLGLPVGIVVGFGAFDCHMGAVAANVRPGVLTKVMGTSTCDITIISAEQLASRSMEGSSVYGICGQVDGSVVPGMLGLEAGQSAFGDLYAWFKNLLSWPLHNIDLSLPGVPSEQLDSIKQNIEDNILKTLSQQASEIAPGKSGITALDWVNGRRTPDADQSLSMAISGLKMGSQAPNIFRALVEATAYGALAITERFQQQGVPVESVVVIGGISKKSDFVVQTCADVWDCPIDVLESEQSCALGAAILASVAAGEFDSVAQAQTIMASAVHKTYQPDPARAQTYKQLYKHYQRLGAFVEGKPVEGEPV